MKERTIYYSDLLNDDFAGTDINTVKLPEDYRYFPKTAIRRGFAGGLNFAVSPLILLLQEAVYGEKIVGREINEADHRALIDSFINDMNDGKGES